MRDGEGKKIKVVGEERNDNGGISVWTLCPPIKQTNKV